MVDLITLWLPDAESTVSTGRSLARSLYGTPVDILLSGPLGAGKTSFMQGFAMGLGVEEPVASPTYALEQRYTTADGRELIHLDLYRLSPLQAAQLIRTSDDHEGIRCIEWAERLEHPTGQATIAITLSERDAGRELRIAFDDIRFPSVEEIERWMDDVRLPHHVRDHCRTVAEFCLTLAAALHERGVIVRTTALHRAGLLHDLLRFIDFKTASTPDGFSTDPETEERWRTLRAQYPAMRHEEACAAFLRERGYDGLADIVAVHGLKPQASDRPTIEQKLLYYADKRSAPHGIVSVTERFEDFARRYGDGTMTEQHRAWLTDAREVEQSLFPDGPPV